MITREKDDALLKRIDKTTDINKKMVLVSKLVYIYWNSSEYHLCLNWGEELLKLSQSSSNIKYAALAKSIIGKAYLQFEKLELSLDNFISSLKLSKDIKNNPMIADNLNNIGIIYGKLNDYDRALEYFTESLSYGSKDKPSLDNLAFVYRMKNDIDRAIQFHRESFDVAKQYADNYRILFAGIEIADLYFQIKKYDESLQFYEYCLSKAIESDDSFRETIIYLGLSECFNAKKETTLANDYLAKAEAAVKKIINQTQQKEAYLSLSNFYSEMMLYKQAFEYRVKYSDLSDSLYANHLQMKQQEVYESIETTRKEYEKSCIKMIDDSEKEIAERIRLLNEQYAEVMGLNEVGFFSDSMKRILLITDKLHEHKHIPVLIEGETGTGKEVVARLIHFGKTNPPYPFICVNCSAIAPSLFETELFGYEGGSYTGSKHQGMPGKLELAQNGTIFLDEIGDLPLEMQPKLLRVLQDKKIYRIGGIKEIKLNIRIICATNQDISKLIETGRFRNDLFYRLNATHIHIPPLRERREEIIPLAKIFLKKFSAMMKKDFVTISNDAAVFLESHNWKGNVRELENTIERAVMLFNDEELKQHHIINHYAESTSKQAFHSQNNFIIDLEDEKMSLDKFESLFIKRVLKHFNGNKTKTAEFLSITRTTLRNKLNRF